MPAVARRSWKSATRAATAIFGSNRKLMYATTAIRKTMSPRRALLEICRPHTGPTSVRLIPSGDGSPAAFARVDRVSSSFFESLMCLVRTSASRCPEASVPIWMLTSVSPIGCSAVRISATETERWSGTVNDVPPLNSRPKLKPRKTSPRVPASNTTPEILNQSRVRPMKSMLASPLAICRSPWKAISGLLRRRWARRLPLVALVLQPLEVHDERVGRDPDRHDEPGDARQGQREAGRLPEHGHDPDRDRAVHEQPHPHDEPERPVEEEHIDEDDQES